MEDVTNLMVQEHKIILRMVALVEKNSALVEEGEFTDWQLLEAVTLNGEPYDLKKRILTKDMDKIATDLIKSCFNF